MLDSSDCVIFLLGSDFEGALVASDSDNWPGGQFVCGNCLLLVPDSGACVNFFLGSGFGGALVASDSDSLPEGPYVLLFTFLFCFSFISLFAVRLIIFSFMIDNLSGRAGCFYHP